MRHRLANIAVAVVSTILLLFAALFAVIRGP